MHPCLRVEPHRCAQTLGTPPIRALRLLARTRPSDRLACVERCVVSLACSVTDSTGLDCTSDPAHRETERVLGRAESRRAEQDWRERRRAGTRWSGKRVARGAAAWGAHGERAPNAETGASLITWASAEAVYERLCQLHPRLKHLTMYSWGLSPGRSRKGNSHASRRVDLDLHHHHKVVYFLFFFAFEWMKRHWSRRNIATEEFLIIPSSSIPRTPVQSGARRFSKRTVMKSSTYLV